MCSGVQIDFAEPGITSRLSGLFTESGLTGMLKASDYRAVDIASLFTGAIVEKCCSLDKTTNVTQDLQRMLTW